MGDIRPFDQSIMCVDKVKREMPVEHLYSFDSFKSFLAVELDSSLFQLYDSNHADLLCKVKAHKCAIMAAEYIPGENVIVTSGNDMTIIFWDANSLQFKAMQSQSEI